MIARGTMRTPPGYGIGRRQECRGLDIGEIEVAPSLSRLGRFTSR